MSEPPDPSSIPLPPPCEIPMAQLGRALTVSQSRWWGHDPVARECVMGRWRNGQFEYEPYSNQNQRWSRDRHLSRVAFFCAHGWQEPVVIALNGDRVRVLDGTHRILAAWVLNHRVITARVLGGDRAKQRLLGIQKPNPSPFFPSPMVLGYGRPLITPSPP